MLTFKQHLTELFDRPLPWGWLGTKPHLWMAGFEVGEYWYEVDFNYMGDASGWEVAFVLFKDGMPELKLSETGNEIAVFSTVAAILKEWISGARPSKFYFTGNGGSRQRLYDKLAKLISKKFKYKFQIYRDGQYAKYVFEK